MHAVHARVPFVDAQIHFFELGIEELESEHDTAHRRARLSSDLLCLRHTPLPILPQLLAHQLFEAAKLHASCTLQRVKTRYHQRITCTSVASHSSRNDHFIP